MHPSADTGVEYTSTICGVTDFEGPDIASHEDVRTFEILQTMRPDAVKREAAKQTPY